MPNYIVNDSDDKSSSCFGGRGVLCALVKPKSAESTRAKYKGMFQVFTVRGRVASVTLN